MAAMNRKTEVEYFEAENKKEIRSMALRRGVKWIIGGFSAIGTLIGGFFGIKKLIKKRK